MTGFAVRLEYDLNVDQEDIEYTLRDLIALGCTLAEIAAIRRALAEEDDTPMFRRAEDFKRPVYVVWRAARDGRNGTGNGVAVRRLQKIVE